MHIVGRGKVAQTIQQQAALGMRSNYQDRQHDLQTVFYSTDGLSIEVIDEVQYDMQLADHHWVKTRQYVNAGYVIV
jgi:hypothetical protein